MEVSKKQIFQTHLAQRWIVYVFSAVLSIIMWVWIGGLVTKDKPKETINIWFTSYSLDSTFLVEECEKAMPDYLRHTRINNYPKDEDYYTVRYQAIGSECDIIILPESYLENSGLSSYLALTGETLELVESYLGSDNEYYEVDGVKCGIKVFDKESTESKNDHVNYVDTVKEGEEEVRENYYLFFYSKSLHLGSLSGNSSMDGALVVARKLLDYVVIL